MRIIIEIHTDGSMMWMYPKIWWEDSSISVLLICAAAQRRLRLHKNYLSFRLFSGNWHTPAWCEWTLRQLVLSAWKLVLRIIIESMTSTWCERTLRFFVQKKKLQTSLMSTLLLNCNLQCIIQKILYNCVYITIQTILFTILT